MSAIGCIGLTLTLMAGTKMQDKPELACKVPLPIIKTWVWMVTESDDPTIIDQGTDNLVQEFGTLTEAQDFIEQYE